MKMLLATTVLTAGLFVGGCADHSEDMRTTGVNTTPDYAGTHYNPAVNSDGALTGRNDPAIRPSAGSATGTPVGGTGPMMNGGNTNGTTVGGGTSTENGGSGMPSGATGNTAGGR